MAATFVPYPVSFGFALKYAAYQEKKCKIADILLHRLLSMELLGYWTSSNVLLVVVVEGETYHTDYIDIV